MSVPNILAIVSCFVSVSGDSLQCLFAVSLETVVVTTDNQQVNGLGFGENHATWSNPAINQL